MNPPNTVIVTGNFIKPVVPQHTTGGWKTLVPTHTSGNFIKLPTIK
jgi:hypothetical protein